MFGIRFVALVFFVYFGWRFGQLPPSDLNSFGKMFAYGFWLTAPALYLLPTYEAWSRRSSNLSSIALVNVFLGWSLIGWVIAAAWALMSSASNSRACPYCAEKVRADAIRCKHCHSDLPAATVTEVYADLPIHQDI